MKIDEQVFHILDLAVTFPKPKTVHYPPKQMQASSILSQPATVKSRLLSPLAPSGPTPLGPTTSSSPYRHVASS